MVARKKLNLNRHKKREANSGSFQKGNVAAVGHKSGNTIAHRSTRRIISKEWFNALLELDPQSQKTMASRLIRKACRDGLLDGKLALAVLEEGTNRIEGKSLQPIVTADMMDKPQQITPDMSPAEAERIFRSMLRRPGTQGDIIDLDEDEEYMPASLPAPKKPDPKPTISQRKPIEEKELDDEIQPDIPADKFVENARRDLHVSPYRKALDNPRMKGR
jgi:hypothetical protein